MSHPTSGDGSFGSLSNDIDDIYRTYAADNHEFSDNHDFSDSLDSSTNENSMADILRRTHLHPNSRLASLPTDADGPAVRSAPGTPLSSTLFDFAMATDHHGITSSSLNVIVATPSSESQYRDLVSTPPLIETGRHALGDDDSLQSADGSEPLPDDTNGSKDDAYWAEKGAAERTSPYDYNVIRRTVKDFTFGKELGEGSYSTVVLATDKLTSKRYAVKILDKRHIIKEKKVKYVNIEKHALNRLSHSAGVISLFFTFQDKHSLYFVLDFASNGELLGLIKQYGSLNEECTMHFGAQILDAIRHMHDNGVIHRDIKPENILLDDKFRIRITDFGTAKLLEKKGAENDEADYPVDVRAKSFVGTAEYVSPELLDSKYCGKPGDIWAYGCILYQMVAGKPPFKATNEYLTFQKITKLQYAFSAGFPLILRDLIKQILVLQPSRRAKIDQIRLHYFFHELDFDNEDDIWGKELPELGPYKMTAKSMMKMPASAQSAKQPTVVKRPAQKKQKPEASIKRVTSESNGKGFSPASVAAFVLNKQDDQPEVESPLPRPQQHVQRTPPAADYIPGTNILRPQIHTMASFSRTSSSNTSRTDDSSKKQKSKVMDVTAPTAVEAAWQQYLNFSERVIHVGLAFVRKQPTEYFHKKYKGFIHEAPLGFSSRLQAAARNNGRSVLSQAAQGSRLRDVNEVLPMEDAKDETDAIKYYFEDVIDSIPEDEEKAPSSITNSTTKIGKALFKKFLHNDKKQDTASDTASVQSSGSGGKSHSHPFGPDKAKTCTIVVTTHGRALIFLRDDQHNDYKLTCEVKLNFPFIMFKEVVSNGSSKFSKLIPLTGMFAIEAPQTTLVFEVEKYEVTQWTEALAKAKLNQIERVKEDQAKRAPKESPRQSPKPSPKLMESPLFSSPGRAYNGNHEGSTSTHHHGQSSPSTLDPKDKPSSLLFHKKVKSSVSVKRRPPPPLPTSNSLNSSGLGKDTGHGESGTVHAAQLAVSNNPNVSNFENRRSSFTRDNNGVATHRSPSAGSGAKITSMNSKFLARSRGKK